MPHQCLQCGKLFGDGSTDLLKGCAGCGGTKFFFTKEAVDAETRAVMVDRTKTDVREMLQEIVNKRERPAYDSKIWSRNAWERWVQGQPDEPEPHPAADVPGPDADETASEGTVGVWDVPTEEVEAPAPKHITAGPPPEVEAPAVQTPRVAEVPEPVARPETLRITGPGSYELDIERLVEKAPVIVEKDGVYMVHLPSVFEQAPSAGGGRRSGRSRCGAGQPRNAGRASAPLPDPVGSP